MQFPKRFSSSSSSSFLGGRESFFLFLRKKKKGGKLYLFTPFFYPAAALLSGCGVGGSFPLLPPMPNHSTVVCKMEARLEYNTHCIHVFACLAPIRKFSRCLLTKFLHLSSVGRLLRVRCWLGVCVDREIYSSTVHPSSSCEGQREREKERPAACCTGCPNGQTPCQFSPV